jgi:prepilin-type N-terminal cleavage/methylation domain-containing protein
MKGFTLIEVMVASLIIMLGVTGFVTLQSQYMRSDAKLKLRSVALKLSQEKLDDLRDFSVLETSAGQLAYNDIASNAGGNLAAGNVVVTLTDDVASTYTFNRQWQVVNQYYVDTDADGTADSWLVTGDPGLPAPLPAVSSQKVIDVTTSWTDTEGNLQSVSLDSNIAPVPLSGSNQAKNESDSSKNSPKVNYTPGQAPDVISYELGNGEKVETSKPVPDVDNQGDNNIVKFETVKYIEIPGQTDKLEQEDFLTVNCSCTLGGIEPALTPSMTVLVDGELTVEPGKLVNKYVGAVANNQQPQVCNSCCIDHHDTATMVADEEYFRSENGSPHRHYERQLNGTYVIASGGGDPYDEVCRFKRVDGLFQIYPDWELLDIVEFDDTFLLSATNLANYVAYSEGLIEADITGNAKPSRPSGRNLTVPPGGYQFISRGIYLDRMKSTHKAAVLAKINAGDSDWKAITPFYDVNLTLLSSWSTANNTVATVTQEAIKSIVDPANDFYGTYSRGRVEALADGSTLLLASANAHNGGITGTDPISPVDEASVRTDNTVTITVDSKSAAEKFFAVIGNINCLITINGVVEACDTNNDRKSSYVDLSSLSISPDTNQFNCPITIPKGKATAFFSCDNVSENWTGDIVFAFAKAGYTTTLSIQYPDTSIVQSNALTLATGLTQTSNQEYSLIIELVP